MLYFLWEDTCEWFPSVQSVSCVWLWNSMDCSTLGFPVHYQLPTACSNWSPLSHLILLSPFSPAFKLPQHLSLFQWVSFLHQIGVSASVLPMNIQDWFLLGSTGWISLKSKGPSRVFSNTTVQKHQFFGTQLYFSFNSHIHTWLLENLYLWLDGPLLAK